MLHPGHENVGYLNAFINFQKMLKLFRKTLLLYCNIKFMFYDRDLKMFNKCLCLLLSSYKLVYQVKRNHVVTQFFLTIILRQ